MISTDGLINSKYIYFIQLIYVITMNNFKKNSYPQHVFTLTRYCDKKIIIKVVCECDAI